MGYLNLTPNDRKRLAEVFETAYPDPDALKILVSTELGMRVSGQIAWSKALAQIVFQVIETTNGRGVLDKLLIAAIEQIPDRPDLRALALDLSRQSGWAAGSLAHGLSVSSALEQLATEGNPFLATTRLATWLIKVERQVGQVRCGTAHGTGFLVAPDLVLTNYHVVKGHLDKQVPATWVQVRFDYREDARGVAPDYNSIAWLPIDPSWEIPCAPYSEVDKTHTGLPAEGELDFALLKLTARPGNDPVGDRVRGWIDLSADPSLPEDGSPGFIVQHPGTGSPAPLPPQMPLQVSLYTPAFDRVNANGTRITYKPGTLHGSSGSPVFDRTLRAVALHHAAGPNIPGLPSELNKTNEGIPLGKIRDALRPEVVAQLKAPPVDASKGI